jgi:gliding motility-associated-like protein
MKNIKLAPNQPLMKKLFFLSLNILIGTSVFAQQGKDLIGNISVANTIVNNVSTTLTSNATIGTTTIAVASTAGLSAGDLLFIMQAQGALVNDSTNYWGNPNQAFPLDTSGGKIHKYNGAGNNEFAEINSIAGNVITLNCTLSDSFRGTSTAGDITTQVVRVQRYSSLTLTGAGSITCNAWNGLTGGVVVIEVQGNTTLANGTSINATAKGFRGGWPLQATGFGSNSVGYNYGNPGNNNGGHKGESIVGDTNQYKKQAPYLSVGTNFNNASNWWNSTPLAICKGNVANGGGGGNSMNCGGGGGSNGGSIALWNGMGNPDPNPAYTIAWSKETPATNTNGTLPPTSSSGGGRGGYAFSAHSIPVTANADPTVTGPNNALWGGDDRHNDGGWGGTPLDYSTGKIFFGGGGGAGDGNDGHASPGANGGGIIYLLSYGTITNAGQIIADGGSPLSTANFGAGAPNSNGDDGAGGGGGGGAIIINSVGTISVTATGTISAQGGAGGNQFNKSGANSNAFGPGGGGGGGYVATSNAVAGITVNAGANGIVTGNTTSSIRTKFPPNGATSGGVGSTKTSVAPFYLTAKNDTVCTSSAASLSVTVNGTAPGGLAVGWYTVATGGTPVSTNNPYTFTSPATAGTYTYYAGTCPGTYRIPVLLVVNPSTPPTLTVSATNTLVCSGATVTLTVSGATSYTWGANAGNATTNTVVVNPSSNTTYTVTGANTGACAGTSTASITINTIAAPSITITPTSYSLCSGINDTLYATGATTYTWSSNATSATTSSVIVSPTVGANTYSVIGSNGVCSSTQTTTINVTATPTVSISPTSATVCAGSSTTFTASGATTYSWSTTATTNTISVSPVSNATYTVTGNNGNCSNTQTVSVVVSSSVTPTLTISTTNTLVCSGATVTLTVSGATSYTWGANAGNATTNTVVVNPTSNTVYTVTGALSGACTGTSTTGIAINTSTAPTITITPTSYSLCSGINDTLYATGATTYTWSSNAASATTSSVIVSPTVGANTYSVIGSNGVCSSTQTTTINVTATPTVSISPTNPTICAGSSTTFTASGATTYSWSTTATTNTISVSPVSNATYTVTGNNGTCSNTQTVSVVVSSSVTPTLTISATNTLVCSGATVTLTVSGATSYTWGANAGNATTNTVVVNPSSNTTYTVTGANTGACAGTSTTSININTIAAPTITITPTSYTLCSGVNDTLYATGATSYTWSANAASATTNSVIVSSTVGANTYSVIGSNGVCSSTQTTIINVTATPTVSISPVNASICTGSSATLTASGATTYSWSTTATTSAISVSPVSNTTYTVTGNNGTCSNTQTILVHVNQATNVAPTVTSPVTYCYGQPTDTLMAATTVNNAFLVWEDASHNTILTPPTPSPSSTILGTTTYYVSQQIIGFCPPGPADSIKVNILPRPNPNFTTSPATDIYVGQTVTFVPTQTAVAYYWNFADPTSSSNTSTNPSPTHVYNTAGSSYCAKLIVTNSLGCKDSTTLCLDILMNVSLIIPNVFSPNDDGINDFFSVKSTGITDLSCDIFDRWGLKLYSWNGVTGYWDGTEKTKKAVEGTYYYVIQTTDVKGVSQTNKGFIELVR